MSCAKTLPLVFGLALGLASCADRGIEAATPAAGPAPERTARAEPRPRIISEFHPTDPSFAFSDTQILGILDALTQRLAKQATLAAYAAEDPEVAKLASDHALLLQGFRTRLADTMTALDLKPSPSRVRAVIEASTARDFGTLLVHPAPAFDGLYVARVISDHEDAKYLLHEVLAPSTKRREIRALIVDDLAPMLENELTRSKGVARGLSATRARENWQRMHPGD